MASNVFNVAGTRVGVQVLPAGSFPSDLPVGTPPSSRPSLDPSAPWPSAQSCQPGPPITNRSRQRVVLTGATCDNHSAESEGQTEYSYKVKIYNPTKRSKFTVRQLYNVTHKFKTVSALRSALYHELGDDVPEEGDYSVGYFEGRQQSKKWLITSRDLEAMYAYYEGKSQVSLWCDGKVECAESDEERTPKKKQKKKESHGLSRRAEMEEELEDVFQKLKDKHGDKHYSGPQLRLWARMIVSKTHDDLNNPPKVPMITGSGVIQKPCKESLTDAFKSAASAIAEVLVPRADQSTASTPLQHATVTCSPNKVADIRMKNIEQLRSLQRLREDGILTEEEFLTQKQIVLRSLTNLV